MTPADSTDKVNKSSTRRPAPPPPPPASLFPPQTMLNDSLSSSNVGSLAAPTALGLQNQVLVNNLAQLMNPASSQPPAQAQALADVQQALFLQQLQHQLLLQPNQFHQQLLGAQTAGIQQLQQQVQQASLLLPTLGMSVPPPQQQQEVQANQLRSLLLHPQLLGTSTGTDTESVQPPTQQQTSKGLVDLHTEQLQLAQLQRSVAASLLPFTSSTLHAQPLHSQVAQEQPHSNATERHLGGTESDKISELLGILQQQQQQQPPWTRTWSTSSCEHKMNKSVPGVLSSASSVPSSASSGLSESTDGQSVRSGRRRARSLMDPVTSDQGSPLPKRRSRPKRTNCTSIYRGVSWHTRDRRWIARVWIKGKVRHLGNYVSEKKAALAVDKMILKEYGEDSTVSLNFPDKEVRARIEAEPEVPSLPTVLPKRVDSPGS